MRVKLLILLVPIFLIACDLDNKFLLPTKSEIIKAAEKTGATNVIVNSYMYSDQMWGNPSINTDGGFKSTNIYNIQVRVTYDGAVSNTVVENGIKQLFIKNKFYSNLQVLPILIFL